LKETASADICLVGFSRKHSRDIIILFGQHTFTRMMLLEGKTSNRSHPLAINPCVRPGHDSQI